MSLAAADVLVLSCCYIVVVQGFAGAPVLGVQGAQDSISCCQLFFFCKLHCCLAFPGCLVYGFLGTVGALAEIW